MTHVWRIAKRDYIETVRSNSFIITILIVPVLLIASIGLPRLLERSAEPSRFALIDLPSAWEERLYAIYQADSDGTSPDEDIRRRLTLVTLNTPPGKSVSEHLQAVRAQVRDTRLFGYVRAGDAETTDSASKPVTTSAATTQRLAGPAERVPSITVRVQTSDDGLRWLRYNLQTVARFERARQIGLSPEQVARLDRPVQIPENRIDESGQEKTASGTDKLAAWAPVIFTYLLWIVTFTLVQRLIMSTIEEKSNRTIELILSSVSPMEFMAGKVLAGVLEGMTVLLAWLVTFYFAAGYFTNQSYLKGVDLRILFSHKDQLVFFGVYFALGFILFAALVVGLGSLCNTIKDTQGLMTPVMLIMMVPLFVMTYVGSHPNTTLSVVLSWIPFFTPFLMMNRIAANPPPGALEIMGSFVVLLLAIYGTTWAGAKLFRVGILLYGKRPSLREVLRILRTPEGRAAARVT